MHATEAAAIGTTFFKLQVPPLPYAEIFWNRILVEASDFKCVGILGDEPIAACLHEYGQDVGGLC